MKTDEVCDHCLETFGAATLGGIYGFVFCCKGRNISYAFVICNKHYTKSVCSWQAINRFAKKTNILRYLIKFVMIFPQKT
jgi:hypothetical protein